MRPRELKTYRLSSRTNLLQILLQDLRQLDQWPECSLLDKRIKARKACWTLLKAMLFRSLMPLLHKFKMISKILKLVSKEQMDRSFMPMNYN